MLHPQFKIVCLKTKAFHLPAAARNHVLFIENFIYLSQKACENNLRQTSINILLSGNSTVIITGFPYKKEAIQYVCHFWNFKCMSISKKKKKEKKILNKKNNFKLHFVEVH